MMPQVVDGADGGAADAAGCDALVRPPVGGQRVPPPVDASTDFTGEAAGWKGDRGQQDRRLSMRD